MHMTQQLKLHWALWVVLVLIVASGVLAIHLSSGRRVSIDLSPNKTVDVSFFRLLPHALNLSLSFNRANWEDKRPELGDFTSKGRPWQESGFLEFPQPGAPIRLLIRAKDKEVVYEALPAGGYNGTTKSRDLVPFVDDGDSGRFQWPPNNSLKPILPSGNSTITISVLEVGPQLIGEKVNLFVDSPISFKTAAPGYEFLWWFFFWPVYAFLLASYGLLLLVKSLRRSNSRVASLEEDTPSS